MLVFSNVAYSQANSLKDLCCWQQRLPTTDSSGNSYQLSSNTKDWVSANIALYNGDYDIAAAAFRRIVDNDSTVLKLDAAYHLGMIYKSGLGGTQKNLSEAFKYFQISATSDSEHPHPLGTFFYALSLATGSGVNKDILLADKYFKLILNNPPYPAVLFDNYGKMSIKAQQMTREVTSFSEYIQDLKIAQSKQNFVQAKNDMRLSQLIAKRNQDSRSICSSIRAIGTSLKETISSDIQVSPDSIKFNRTEFIPLEDSEPNRRYINNGQEGMFQAYAKCVVVIYTPKGTAKCYANEVASGYVTQCTSLR